MKPSNLLSDEAVLAKLGERLSRHRVERQLTQAVLAKQAENLGSTPVSSIS